MKAVTNRTWKLPAGSLVLADPVKAWLLARGGIQDTEVKSPHEVWRIRYSDATFTLYRSGTLFVSSSHDGALREAQDAIDGLLGSRFLAPSRDFSVGFDETGKGEILGHLVLVGVAFPRELCHELEIAIGSADSKEKHSFKYWDDLSTRIDSLTGRGLTFEVATIPPWDVDRFNVNTLLDLTYQRMLLSFALRLQLERSRIVLDNYGIGPGLSRYLRALEAGGAEVVATSHADDIYLEARVASLISKAHQQRTLGHIAKSPDFMLPRKEIGSGNAGDPKTLDWLKTWHATGRPWPWFVKRSFKTLREIDPNLRTASKTKPPINEHLLSSSFRSDFDRGRLNIRSLSVVCPYCGAVSKSAILVATDSVTEGRCPSCRRNLPHLALTLRYYCGRVLPDTNVLLRGILSKDLRRQSRFFENFTILLHPVVAREGDSPAGKQELERLGRFHSMGRIRLEMISSSSNPRYLDNFERDQAIREAAGMENAILTTADNGMKGAAQASGLFVLEV
jgi:ribonuclease HII